MAWHLLELSVEPASTDQRRAARRRLRFAAEVAGPENVTRVLVLDLSEAGMMLHTDTEFDVDETVMIELPEAGEVAARIAWRRAPLYGCEFLAPVSRGAVSAALLRSPGKAQDGALSAAARGAIPAEDGLRPPAAARQGRLMALFLALLLAAMILLVLDLAGRPGATEPELRRPALPAPS